MQNLSLNRLKIAGLALLVTFILVDAAVVAQEADPSEPAIGGVEQTTIRAYAAASLDVDELIEYWRARIDATSSEFDAQQLFKMANDEIAEAIRSHGLDVPTYNYIYQTQQNDPEFAAVVEEQRQSIE